MGNGSDLRNLSGFNLQANSVPESKLDPSFRANVARLNTNQNFTGANSFGNAGNQFTGSFTGDGSGLTALNASSISGTIPDAQLSANVAKLNPNQTFTGTNIFTNAVGIGTNNPQSTLHVAGTVTADALRSPGAGINTSTFAFTHRAVATNTSGNVTTIYNSLTDGDPNAILLVTHNWSADTNSISRYNTNLVGVYYAANRWTIFNEQVNGTAPAMALGRAFNVMVIKP